MGKGKRNLRSLKCHRKILHQKALNNNRADSPCPKISNIRSTNKKNPQPVRIFIMSNGD
jgi:hypothetical protein